MVAVDIERGNINVHGLLEPQISGLHGFECARRIVASMCSVNAKQPIPS